MIYHCAYVTPAGERFPVDIEAPDEAKARLTWGHRHPERLGYRLESLALAAEGAVAHLDWKDYASEYGERFSSPVVKSVEMGLVILTLLGYVLCISGGTALGLWLGMLKDPAHSMPLAALGMGVGIVLGYAVNVILDWMRSVVILQHEIIERLAREEPAAKG